MNRRAGGKISSRAPKEESPVIKKETNEHSDEHSISLSRMKTEPNEDHWGDNDANNKEALLKVANTSAINTENGEFEATVDIEQLFIKNENDQNTKAMDILSSIKSEPSDIEWDNCEADKINVLQMRLEHNGSEMDMDSKVNTSEADSSRIKNEYSGSDNLEVGAVSGNFEYQLIEVKSETDMDSKDFQVAEITEECSVKSESESSMNATPDIASTSMAKCKFQRKQLQVKYKKTGSNIFSCYNCNHIAYSKRDLIRHLKMHSNEKSGRFSTLETCVQCHAKFKSKAALHHHNIQTKHDIDIDFLEPTLTDLDTTLSTCIHCNATFKSKVSLDDHIIRKHPDFITSVTRKIFECAECYYKTSIKNNFKNHMSVHGFNYRLDPCSHCNATFKSKVSLDDHILKKHPEFVTSITRKIYKCSKCVYQTTVKNHFNDHMSVHPETATGCICMYCNASLKSKRALDDHMVRKHLAAPAGRKIFECRECSYRTIQKSYLANHMLTHFKTFSTYKLSTCAHCQATFKSTRGLDDHVVKNHPNFITSVARKIHECSKCGYKTILKFDYDKHNATLHPETPSPHKRRECLHCDSSFTSRMALDNHVVKKHPDFITSVTSKLYECTECHYKTTMKHDFNRHTSMHQGTTPSYSVTCAHCNVKLKSKRALDDHVIRKHPDFVTSVSRKIHECSMCSYKTLHKSSFDKHMTTHTETTSSAGISRCIHCDTISLDDNVTEKNSDLLTSDTKKVYECSKCLLKLQ
nr:unnamed protein product [Callosobruchus chinensis]